MHVTKNTVITELFDVTASSYAINHVIVETANDLGFLLPEGHQLKSYGAAVAAAFSSLFKFLRSNRDALFYLSNAKGRIPDDKYNTLVIKYVETSSEECFEAFRTVEKRITNNLMSPRKLTKEEAKEKIDVTPAYLVYNILLTYLNSMAKMMSEAEGLLKTLINMVGSEKLEYVPDKPQTVTLH